MAEKTLDPSTLQALKDLDAGDGFFPRIVQLFVNEGREHLQRMQTSILTQDLNVLHRSAHFIKASGATLGATRFHQICEEIEDLKNFDRVQPLMNELENEFQKIRNELHV